MFPSDWNEFKKSVCNWSWYSVVRKFSNFEILDQKKCFETELEKSRNELEFARRVNAENEKRIICIEEDKVCS